ncbi:MAG: thioredoxin family protein [Halobacteriales archaeon]
MSNADDLESIREQKLEELQQRTDGQSSEPEQPTGSPPAPAEPVHIDSKQDLTRLTEQHPIVLADFYADWCGPCQMLEPTVREIAQETAATVAKIDIDALPQLAQELRVQGVPSLFLYVDGEPVEQMVGVQDYGTLESLIEQYAA